VNDSNSGFTLIELMITLVVLAILLAVGVPSFNNLIENNRVTAQANSLLGAVNLARSEAVKRGVPVSVRSEDGGFEEGWCVIVGGLVTCQNAEGAGALIRTFGGNPQVSIDGGGLNGITFDNRGYRAAPAAGNVEINVEPDSCEENETSRRVLSVSLAGRASLNQGVCE